jgi:hypothetical protein
MFSNCMQKVMRRLHRLANLPVLVRFRAHNRKVLATGSNKGGDAPIMLMELNTMHSAHIAYAYLADEMAKSYGAQVKTYAPRALKGVKHKLSFRFKALVGWAHFGTYRSFGTNEFLEIKLTDVQRERARALYKQTLPRLKSTRDVEDMRIKGIWIGDLVYDTYLMTTRKPTINLADEDFKQLLLESLELYVFWDDYLTNHTVCGVNVSHCVYNLAIPLRLAVYRDILAFQASVTHVYRLSRDNLFAYNDFFHFRERFIELPEEVREAGITLAQHRIQRRFAGEVGVDMAYSTKSAYVGPKHSHLLRKSNKRKILIATHCFFDSPHSYGKNLFPDFYEWLNFLGEISNQTDYDWYIKTHPDYLQGTKEIIDYFVERFPKLTLLPSDASHHQIISEGIDLALTCYGTVGFEYAALGIPVVNASMNNPHIAYNFNIHAKDVDHYRKLLMNIDDIHIKINRQEVYEYYFMKFIFNTENIFFEDYQGFLNNIGDYENQFSSVAYEKWLAEWTLEKHLNISESIRKFIESGDFRMDGRHTGKQFILNKINT